MCDELGGHDDFVGHDVVAIYATWHPHLNCMQSAFSYILKERVKMKDTETA